MPQNRSWWERAIQGLKIMLYIQSVLKYMIENRGLYGRLGGVILEAMAYRTSQPCSRRVPHRCYPQREAASANQSAVVRSCAH